MEYQILADPNYPGLGILTSSSVFRDSLSSVTSLDSDYSIELMDLSCKDIKDHCLRTLAVFGAPPELCSFYGDVVQCEFDITRTIYRLQNDLRGSGVNDVINHKTPSLLTTDGHVDSNVLFVLEQNLIRRFNEWKATVDKLMERQPHVPAFRIHLNDDSSKVKAGCSMHTDQVDLRQGEDFVVTDTSQPNWMRIRNSSGDEGYVPALSCILPTPDDNTLTAVERLQILLLTSWAECVRKLKTLLEATLNHYIKQLVNGWNTWINGGQHGGRVGLHLRKLADCISSRQCQTSTELIRIHRHLCRVESEVLELSSNVPGLTSFKETVANLDKAVLCFQAFNKNWRLFRQDLCRADRPIKLVEQWEQLRRAKRCNNFKYYELKMTVEEQEQLEELTYIGGSVRAASNGESRSSKESVEAERMTAIKQEERKRFLIRSVTDPRTGEVMALRDAVAEGIIDYKMGKYINPDTGEGVPIAEAMKSGVIIVDYTSTHRSTPITDVVSLLTVRRLIVDDAYTVVAALDAETAERVPVVEAVQRGILDLAGDEDGGGEFVNMLNGSRMPLEDAIEDGWVFAEFEGKEPRYSTTTHEVIGVVDRGGSNLNGTYRSTTTAPAAGLISFVDAIRRGLLDRHTGNYVDPLTGRRVYVAEAIRQGLIKTRIIQQTDEDNRLHRRPTLPLVSPKLLQDNPNDVTVPEIQVTNQNGDL